MKQVKWSLLKSARLKRTRGASFEDILDSKFIGAKEHPGREHQRIMLFEYKRYVWIVPYVENEREIFLKTLYPSRKYTKAYRKGEL